VTRGREQNHPHASRRLPGVAVFAVALLVAGLGVATSPPEAASAATPTMTRISGADRYVVSAKVSKEGFPSGSDVAYLTTGTKFPDALSGAPAAAVEDAPLLLTAGGSLPSAIATELARLAPERVVILGSTASVSSAVQTAVAAAVRSGAAGVAPTIQRIDGRDRYAVSRSLVSSVFDEAPHVYVATGENYPDALAASAAAGAQRIPVVLVRGSARTVDAATVELLRSLGTQRVSIAGGTPSVSSGVGDSLRNQGFAVGRLQGADRFSASVAVSRSAFPTASRAFLTNGYGFADGLSGAALAARTKSPLYLSRTACVPDDVKSDITSRLRAGTVTLLGGNPSLNGDVAAFTDCSTLAARQKAASESSLKSKLVSRLNTFGGWYSVSVRKLGGLGETVSQAGTAQKEPASSIKIFAAYAALHRIDIGRFTLSTRLPSGETVGNCMRAMIHVSDNYCHTDLIRYMGLGNLNDQFAKEGYPGTHYAAGGYATKTSTADDLTLLLARLEKGTLLGASSTAHLKNLLATQVWRTRIAAGLPPGVKASTKPGELWRTSGMIQTDAGIVYARSGTYVIAVMGADGASKPEIGALSRIVYEHFNGRFGSAASYPTQQLVTNAVVNLRSSPGGSPIAQISRGALVEVTVSTRTWYYVTVNGRSGYIHMSSLSNRY
jgi:putative cell wall-binding protein/beta-lactamase class A